MCLRRWDALFGPSERELLAIRMFGDERGLALPLPREQVQAAMAQSQRYAAMYARMYARAFFCWMHAVLYVGRVVLECVLASRCM